MKIERTASDGEQMVPRFADRPARVVVDAAWGTIQPLELAASALLDRGYPADRLRDYRGGLHDWMTLGLPIEGSRAAGN